jgi:hypothetical protein
MERVMKRGQSRQNGSHLVELMSADSGVQKASYAGPDLVYVGTGCIDA